MPSPTQTVPITAVREVAPGVREITLAAPDPPLAHAPGQWISLHLPVGEHPPLVRAYTLAAPPLPSGELVLCLDRVPDGLGSGYLFSLAEGDPITFAGPLGNFVLPPEPAGLLWLARYTGIVPFRAMLMHLRERPPAEPVTLLYQAPRRVDLAYREELDAAAAAHGWFDWRPVLEEPGEAGEGGARAVLDLLPGLLERQGERTPMICGKREFVRPIRDFFYARGYERRAVKWENYD